MLVTLLGHATVLLEMGPMQILMDPILEDRFEDGMVGPCPKREIDTQQLPREDDGKTFKPFKPFKPPPLSSPATG